MKKQKSTLKVKLTAIAFGILAILVFAVPCGAQIDDGADGYVDIDEIANIDYAIEGNYLMVLGTANLYPGGYIDWGIYAVTGCTINIYGGEIGDGFFVLLYTGEPMPVVTVYGTDFALDGVPLDPLDDHFFTDSLSGCGLLTGNYGNGDLINLKFYSDVPIFLAPPDMQPADTQIAIDIKPGNEQNNINLKSKGVVPVAVLTTDDFDAATIDPTTALFAGAAPKHWGLEDVDHDGDDDVIFHFRTQELELDHDSTEATLTAQLSVSMTAKSTEQVRDGSAVSGTDEVRIISSKKSKK